MYHYRKTRKVYDSRLFPKMCPFCDPKTFSNRVAEFEHSYIVPNITKYDSWELHDVTEHLLLVPKEHHESLVRFSSEAKLEVMDIMSQYEAKGYNVYSRAIDSPRRSVAHQHTHFIRINGDQARAALFLKKPYNFIKF